MGFALFIAWVCAQALAGDAIGVPDLDAPAPPRVETVVLAWDDVGFAPAGPERKAIGPDVVVAGPQGFAALVDPVGSRVVVLDELAIVGSFAAPRVDDLAFTGAGDLVLADGRRLLLVDVAGAELDRLDLGGLAPSSFELRVVGDEIVGADVFGNLHRLATVDGRGLSEPVGDALIANPHTVTREGGGFVVDGARIPTPTAKKASARVIDAAGTTSGASWTLIEAVVADRPVRVERFAWQGGVEVALPGAGRAYAPARDVAVDPEGRLLWLDPQADGLHLSRVTR